MYIQRSGIFALILYFHTGGKMNTKTLKNLLKSTILSSALGLFLTGCNGDWCVKKDCTKSSQCSENSSSNKRDYTLFPFDSDDMSSSEKEVVAFNASQNAKSDCVTVSGHCSKEGKPAYNVALGSRRANSAAQALKASGYKGDVKTVSYGASKVFVEGDSEADLAPNRRAIFHPGSINASTSSAKQAKKPAVSTKIQKPAIMNG